MPEELTLDQQLESLATELNPPAAAPPENPVAPATGAAQTPQSPGGNAVPPAASPEGGTSPTEQTELEKALAQIEEEPTGEEPKGPQLSDEQKQVLDIVKTPQEAQNLVDMATGYQNFTGTLAKGDFDGAIQMLHAWRPDVVEGLFETIFQKFCTGENAPWVSRWLADQDLNPTVNTALRSQQREIALLKAQIAQRSNNEQTAQSQQRQQAIANGYVQHINGLFDIAKQAPEDRKYIRAAIDAAVMADPELRAKLNTGNFKAVNSVVKREIREYNTRDQAKTSAQGAKLQSQEQHKPPLQVGQMALEGQLPDDIRQVPKGQEENWMDQMLGKLAASVRRK